MTGREERSELAAAMAEQLREWQSLRAQMTEWTATLMAQNLNDVLETALAVLDSFGGLTRDFRAPYAAVAVSNNSGGLLTVNSGPRQSGPYIGAGAFEIPTGSAAVVNLVGTALTIYGPPAGRLSYSVFSRPQPPTFGRVTL